MILKVCGIKNSSAVKILEKALPDWLGFIFYPPSPRCFEEEPKRLARFRQFKKVGVFVNEQPEQVLRIADEAELDFIQLHGSESPDYLRKIAAHCKIIKAFGIDNSFDFTQLDAYRSLVSYFLFDTLAKEEGIYGGSGRSYDRMLLKQIGEEYPYLISGGIDPEEAARLLEHPPTPSMAGIDINSKFEDSPGYKNPQKISDIVALKKKLY